MTEEAFSCEFSKAECGRGGEQNSGCEVDSMEGPGSY